MKKIILVLSALVLMFQFSFPVILNVPGTYSTIQEGINASVNGDTVLVEQGTYMENINFRGKRIVLTSRYYVTNDPATIAATIINGSTPVNPDTASCVIISSGEDSTTVLQGFTLTGGGGTRWEDEHGLGSWYREGGGILIQYSFPIIQNNIIKDNNITNNTNVVSTGGGGIRMGDSYPRIRNNIIMRNSGKYGAGIVLNFSGAEISNNIICLNFGSTSYGSGAGIWMTGPFTRPKLIFNNTIVYNSASTGTAGVLCASSTTLKNNIIWGNSTVTQVQGSVSATYNDVQGGYSGSGNINADPLFNDSNYILLSSSPCVDKGDSNTIYNDLPDPGNPTLAKYPSRGGLRNDIGAYGGPLAKILTNSIIGIKQISGEVPSGFALNQNYPNPFNPKTVISFSIWIPSGQLAVNSLIKLTIYDILGREIQTIVNEKLSPGTYEVKFDGSEYGSGVYFYSLETGSYRITRKMILAK